MSSENPIIKKLDQVCEITTSINEKNTKALVSLKDRVETLESLKDLPKGAANDDNYGTPDDREHKSKFLDWIRKPRDGMTKRILEEAEGELQKKAITIGSDAGGGYAVPALIYNEIESRVQTQNPFRQLVSTVQAGSSDFKQLVSKNSASSGWAAEGGARGETTTSDLIAATPTWGVLYSYPKASEESMQDIFFNVSEWLTQEAADGFASAEATAIWSGNGTAKPTGLTNATPVTTDDTASPERAQGALKYLPLTNGSPVAINADDLIAMVYDIKTGYLSGPGSAWVMNRSTALLVRQLKDTTNNYIWEPNTQLGQPPMLLGFPVYMTDAMDAASAGLFPIAFGNFRRGYVLADHASGMRITVDDNITTPGQVKFYIRKRVGGQVLNNECVRLLKFADA